jgi:superfamily II DNA or RNA helicase
VIAQWIIVDGSAWVADLTSTERGALRLPSPEHAAWEHAARRGSARPEPDRWMVPVERVDDVIRMPRHAPVMRREVIDRTVAPPADTLTLRVELRPYQDDAVTSWLFQGSGTVLAPCGAGKTTIGAAAIACVASPALILVHTHDLAAQWRDRVRSQLATEPGDLEHPSRVSIATVQSLARWTREERRALGERFGLVVLDEAHHAPAATFATVLGDLAGRYRLGLTATPTRRDGLQALIEWCCGPIVARIEQRDLERMGYTLTPTIEQRPTGWSATAPEAVDRQAEIEAATVRNAMILDGVRALTREGRRVLLLADRVAHVEALAGELVAAGLRAAALTSRSTKRRRAEVLAAMGAGDLDVLAATSLADEGLDVASLDAVVLAAPSGNPARVQQRIGRALRPAPGKTARILDFVDGDVWARSAAKKRRKLYHDLGWVVTHG